MLHHVFYFLLAPFIINEAYYLLNRGRLSRNYGERDLFSFSRLDLVHYTLKTLSFPYSLIGFFGSFPLLFGLLVACWLMKFVLYHINLKVYALYSLILPILNAMVYCVILYLWIRC